MRQKLAAIALSSFVLLSPVWAGTPSPSPKQTTRVIEFNQNTNEAVLRAHIKPGDPIRNECMTLLGMKLLERGELPQAEKFFKDVLANIQASSDKNWSSAVSHAGLALISMEQGNFQQGKQYYAQGLQYADHLQPMYKSLVANMYTQYSQMLFETGQVNEAADVLKKAYLLDPKCQFCSLVKEQIQFAHQQPDYLDEMPPEIIRWNNETHLITVHLGSGEGMKDWNPEFLNLAKKALAQWQQASNGLFQFQFVEKPEAADVRIIWKDHDEASDQDGLLRAGEIHTDMNGGNLAINDIWIYLHHLDLNQKQTKTNKDEIYSTLLHEMGHMLGIQGHSPSPADIMSQHAISDVISERDIATLKGLYQKTPNYTNPPGTTLAQYRNSLGLQ